MNRTTVIFGAVLLAIIAIVFIVSPVIRTGVSQLNSPDENAYWQSAVKIAAGEHPRWLEELNLLPEVTGMITSRSLLPMGQWLTPGSFIGLPFWYGWIGRITSVQLIPWLTLILTLITAFVFSRLMAKLFGWTAGVIGALLFLSLPAILYFSGRGLFPNVSFVSLLALSVMCLGSRACWGEERVLFRFKWQPAVWSCLVGLLLGIGLSFRWSESVWVIPLVFVLLWLNRERLHASDLFWMVVGGVMGAVPVFYEQYVLYGQWQLTAYDFRAVGAVNGTEASVVDRILSSILPFGFHPRQMLNVMWQYVALFNTGWLVFTLAGLYRWWNDAKHPFWIKSYLWLAVIVSGWLLLYYGSWLFYDNWSWQWTVATSYHRYLLPLFVVWLPLSVYGLTGLWNYRKIGSIIVSFLLVVNFGWSVYLVNNGDEGLLTVAKTVEEYQERKTKLLTIVPVNGIIVTTIGDKWIWPERKVSPYVRNRTDWLFAKVLLEASHPVYLYHFTLQGVEYQQLIDSISSFGLKIEPVEIDFVPKESLYQIKKR
ncbi:MAG: hypothetical protein V1707_02575 [bacterium]